MKRYWFIGFIGFMLIALIGLFIRPSQASMPLRPLVTVAGLPTIQDSMGFEFTPIKSLTPNPTGVSWPETTQLAQAAPRQVTALADPSNYGDRYLTDINGQILQNEFIVVLHETVGSAQSAINLFRTHHARDEDQVSYHTLIGQDGTIYYIVPPEKRAFGAGNSVFHGPNGPETVRTHPTLPPSVNNFAYHVSLETPRDGFHHRRSHSGYTQAQYGSLAWLMAQTVIPDSRITTHQAVDRSGSRIDPRSFDRQRFLSVLHRYAMRPQVSG